MTKDHVNQGTFCRLVVQNLINATPSRTINVQDALYVLKHAGWKTSCTTYQQQRKHLYEVFRQARRDGLSSIRIDGDTIFLDEEEDFDKEMNVSINQNLVRELSEELNTRLLQIPNTYELDIDDHHDDRVKYVRRVYQAEIPREFRSTLHRAEMDQIVKSLVAAVEVDLKRTLAELTFCPQLDDVERTPAPGTGTGCVGFVVKLSNIKERSPIRGLNLTQPAMFVIEANLLYKRLKLNVFPVKDRPADEGAEQ